MAQKKKKNDRKTRVEIHSDKGTITNVEHTTLQENIDRAANVHDAPTREEHISRQDDYNNLFNSDVGSRYLDANEREDDRIHGTKSSNSQTDSNRQTDAFSYNDEYMGDHKIKNNDNYDEHTEFDQFYDDSDK